MQQSEGYVPVAEDGVENHRECVPEVLSPSRMSDFVNCPRAFYYKTILGLSSPPTVATIKGNLVHNVCEHLYDLPPDERTLPTALNMVPSEWEAMKELVEIEKLSSDADAHVIANHKRDVATNANVEVIQTLIPKNSKVEEQLFVDVEMLLRNWFMLETVNAADPTQTQFPDGIIADGREVHVKGTVGGVKVHGFIDRLNSFDTPTGPAWLISDYKTGRVPGDAWVDKSFFQLKIYAAAFNDTYGVKPAFLRLVYLLASQRSQGVKQIPVTDAMLNTATQQIKAIKSGIDKSARTRTWPTKTSKLCQWCFFQPQCPAWNTNLDGIGAETETID